MLLVMSLLTLNTRAAPGRISRVERPVKGLYIVVLDDSVHPVGEFARGLAASLNARAVTVWDSAIRGFLVEATEVQAIALSRHPLVKYVEENANITVSATQTNAPLAFGSRRSTHGCCNRQ